MADQEEGGPHVCSKLEGALEGEALIASTLIMVQKKLVMAKALRAIQLTLVSNV